MVIIIIAFQYIIIAIIINMQLSLCVLWSDKTSLIAHFKAQRNDSFKNSACHYLPMDEVTPTKFSHVLH